MRILTAVSLPIMALCVASTANALDARSVAMGGTGASAGVGYDGAMRNPALLAKQKSNKQKFSFALGVGLTALDSENVVDTLSDLQTSVDNLETEIDKIKNTSVNPLVCNTEALTPDSNVCLTDISAFRGYLTDAKGQLADVNNKPIQVVVQPRIGFAVPAARVPFAFGVQASVAIDARNKVTSADLDYLQEFINNTGSINELTVGDIRANDNIDVSGTTVTINEPDDVLTSSVAGAAQGRLQTSVALGFSSVLPQGQTLYWGISPKVSKLTASTVQKKLSDDPNEADLGDQLDANQVTKTTVTADAGILVEMPNTPGLSVAGVISNIIPEKITTNDGLTTFKTDPQLTASVSLDKGFYTLTADLDVNKAKQDGLASQNLGMGAELRWKYFGIRAGVSQDLVQEGDATYFSTGLDLGFLEIGARFNGNTSGEVVLQSSFSF